MGNKFIRSFFVGVLALAVPAFAGTQESQTPQVRKIRWFMAHNPGNTPVVDLIKQHTKQMEDSSGGTLKFELIFATGADENLQRQGHMAVLSGKAEMSQITVSNLRKHNFELMAFDMPFVFRSYDHAQAVLNSSVADRLLAGFHKGSDERLRGFAFTFSGGYRVLFGNRPVRTISDLKGAKIWKGEQTSVRGDYLQRLGVQLVNRENKGRDAHAEYFASGKVDLDEGELNRLAVFRKEHPQAKEFTKYVNVTHHNMYVTMIMMNERFYRTLTTDQQKILNEGMVKLAKAERTLSLELEKQNSESLAKEGVQFVEYSPEELKKFEEAGEGTHKKYAPKLAKVIKEIRAVKETGPAYAGN